MCGVEAIWHRVAVDALLLVGGGASLIVGLTVVAYGTPAPEVIVSIQAAAGGYGDVALGNDLGSNIANIGLILDLSVLVRPATVDGALKRRELPVLLISTLAIPAVLFDGVRRSRPRPPMLAVPRRPWAVEEARPCGHGQSQSRPDSGHMGEPPRVWPRQEQDGDEAGQRRRRRSHAHSHGIAGERFRRRSWPERP